MDADALLQINEYSFSKDSASAWQNVAHLRLEWIKVGGWTQILQNSLADLYCAFMDTNFTDERMQNYRMEISNVLKLFTTWMDGWEALENGGFASEWDKRYTASRYFLRNLAHVKNANLDNLP
eukprot:10157341-Alexandrium_andersonii.AAC.1